METNRNIKALNADEYPNIGSVLANFFKKHSINKSKLATQLNVPNTSVTRYVARDTLQFMTLWNISISLNHNFIAELGELLPVEFVTKRELLLQKQIDALQKDLEKLNIELSVYKNIVGK